MAGITGHAAPFAQTPTSDARSAVFAGTVTVICVLCCAALFPEASAGAVRVWLASPTFNHCFLVLPISLFMIWQRRMELDDMALLPEPRAAIAVLALAIPWLAASEAGILEAQQLVIVTMLQAALCSILGLAYYRKLLAPFLYLYFLVPSGAFLVPVLQSITSRFAVAGLHLLGIPVFSNGAVIEIPAGTFAVADACAGLRFLVAAVAFGVFFAVLTYRSWWRRAAFVALSAVVPIIANGFRALALIATAQWIGSPTAALADHVTYGWLFFTFVLLLLVLLGNLFADRSADRDPKPGWRAPEITRPRSWLPMIAVAAACLVAGGAGPVAASFLGAPRLAAMPNSAPRVGSPWRESHRPADWKPIVATPAREFLQSFARGPDRIDRYVGLFVGSGHRNTAIRLDNRDANEPIWTFDSAREATLVAGHRTIPVRESIWIRGSERRTVWSFYDIGGRTAAGVWTAKWDQFRAFLTASRCVSAYVVLSANTIERTSAAAAGDLLAASQDLDSYLCGSTRTR